MTQGIIFVIINNSWIISMEINRITAKEYQQLFPAPTSVFNSVAFSELNKEKCLDVHYLVFRDTKNRLGIVLGEREDSINVPFSATYGGFSFNSIIACQHYDEACMALREYAQKIGKPLYITLAPPIYNVTDNTKTFEALMRAGATVESIEYNQHFELARFADYENVLDSKIKNKLRNALNGGLNFIHLNSKNETDVARAYQVIRVNHIERGNPLHMSLQNVLDTIKVIPADFFVVEDGEGHDVAAAMIFHTTKDIYQIVYWGDVPEYSHLRSMNFLSYKIFEYYYSKGIKILDIGISTENGVPNYGLCEFKENIGCYATIKYSLKL